MTRRRLFAVGLVAATLTVGAVAFAGPAESLPLIGNCAPGIPDGKTPPVPASPDSGGPLASVLMPDEVVHGDPFAPDAKVSIVDQYGYGGLEWGTYDLGCGGALSDPMLATHALIDNQMMLGPITLLQLVGALSKTIDDAGWLAVFDHVFEGLAAAVMAHPFAVLFPLMSMMLAVAIVTAYRKQRLSEIGSHVGWWLLIAVSSIVLLMAPTAMAHRFDDVLNLGMGTVRETFGPAAGPLAQMGPTHRDVLYNEWLTGMFGSAESPAAQKYGADLFKAQAFSRDELAKIGGNAQAYKDAVRTKNDAFVDTAQHVQDEYPDAYLNLQGKRPSTRLMAAVGAQVKALAVALFLIWAGFALAVALWSIRQFMVLWPLIGIIAVLPKQRHRLFDVWDKLTGAIVRAVVAGFAAGLVSALIGGINTAPGTNQFTRLLASVVVSVGAWRATKPFRESGAMPGARRWMRRLETAITAAAGAKAGAAAGVAAGQRPEPLPSAPTGAGPSATVGGHPGYDAGHAVRRGGTSGALPYRPAAVSPPSYKVLDAVPTIGDDGRQTYTTRVRAETRHRKVSDDADHRHSRGGATAQPAGPQRSAVPAGSSRVDLGKG